MGSLSTRSRTPTGSVFAETQSGVELISNGAFDDSSDWIAGFGWTIADGVLKTTTGVTSSSIQQNLGMISGNTYATTFTVKNIAANSVKLTLGGVDGTARDANGTFNEDIVPDGTNDHIYFTGITSFQGEIDDVSVVGDTETLNLK